MADGEAFNQTDISKFFLNGYGLTCFFIIIEFYYLCNTFCVKDNFLKVFTVYC